MIENKVALVTGASSGIGRACVVALVGAGAKVVAIARRMDRLHQLQEEFPGSVIGIEVDVRDREAVIRAVAQLEAPWSEVSILVNSAGLALGMEKVYESDPNDWDRMLDTNVRGVLNTIHAIVPGMVKRGDGFVVNIGSNAAKESYPKGAVYSASKAAVDKITVGLRMDLLGTGVRTCVIHPNRTASEFHEVRFRGDKELAEQKQREIRSLQPEDVADAVLWSISRPAHVQIAEMLIFPTDQAASNLLHKNG